MERLYSMAVRGSSQMCESQRIMNSNSQKSHGKNINCSQKHPKLRLRTHIPLTSSYDAKDVLLIFFIVAFDDAPLALAGCLHDRLIFLT